MEEERQLILDLIKRAIEKKDYLMKISDVFGIAVGFREKSGERTEEPVLTVYVRKGRKKKDPKKLPPHQRIPRSVRIKAGKRIFNLNVDLIESELGKPGTGTVENLADQSILSGHSVGNRLSRSNTGTIGWIARRIANNEPVICGNFHTFLRFFKSAYQKQGPHLTYRHSQSNPEYVMSPSRKDRGDINLDIVGNVILGKRNSLVDIAIASLLDPNKLIIPPYINRLGTLRSAKHYGTNDFNLGSRSVYISGRTSRRLQGNIVEINASHPFKYPDKPNGVMMTELISTDIPTQGGDSGSLLVNETLNALGMLIGRAKERSFFMPIRNIMKAIRIKEFS